MAIIRAAALNLDQQAFRDLVRNPLIEFSTFSDGKKENPLAGIILCWNAETFKDEVKTAVRVLEADEPWLKKMRSGDVVWDYEPNIELFGEPEASFVLPKNLLRLAAERGLDVHIRVTMLQEPELMDLIEKWRRHSEGHTSYVGTSQVGYASRTFLGENRK